MLIQDVQKLNNSDRFLYWIRERESIRNKRLLNEKKPWTDDVILQTYKFCNVRRMDDRVSVWLYDNWYTQHYNHPNMLFAVTMARQFNNTETLEEIGFPFYWDPNRVKRICQVRSHKGLKNFSAAYMITGTLGGSKIVQIVDKVVDFMYHNPPEIDTSSIQNTWSNLLKYPGFASFIAGQVTADLRWAMDGSWLDKYIWAPMGPGSKRGLNRLLGFDHNTSMTRSQFDSSFSRILKLVNKNVPEIADRLEAIDVQNCLCEFDKYERTLWEGRRPKQKYPGGA